MANINGVLVAFVVFFVGFFALSVTTFTLPLTELDFRDCGDSLYIYLWYGVCTVDTVKENPADMEKSSHNSTTCISWQDRHAWQELDKSGARFAHGAKMASNTANEMIATTILFGLSMLLLFTGEDGPVKLSLYLFMLASLFAFSGMMAFGSIDHYDASEWKELTGCRPKIVWLSGLFIWLTISFPCIILLGLVALSCVAAGCAASNQSSTTTTTRESWVRMRRADFENLVKAASR